MIGTDVGVVRGRSGTVILVLVALLSSLIGLAWLKRVHGSTLLGWHPNVSSNHIMAALGIPTLLAYTESDDTNPYRGVLSMCRAMRDDNRTEGHDMWMLAAGKGTVRKEKKSVATMDDRTTAVTARMLMDRIRVWKGAKKGQPRLLCVVYLHHPNDATNAKTQIALWASRCDRYFLVTNAERVYDVGHEPGIVKGIPIANTLRVSPAGGYATDNIWQVLQSAVRLIVSNETLLATFDYVTFAGDDTFIFVENMRKMLMEPAWVHINRLAVPMVFGHRLVETQSRTPFLAGASFSFNIQGLRMMGLVADSVGLCRAATPKAPEDIAMGECWQALGMTIFDTRDELGHDRFHSHSVDMLADMANVEQTGWYRDYRRRPVPRGLAIMSEDVVVLHYTEAAASKALFESVYRQQAPVVV